MEELLNKKVEKICLSPDYKRIYFIVGGDGKNKSERERIYFKTFADCCSETWFSEIIDPEKIINHKIIKVIEMPNKNENGTRQEEDTVYCYKLVSEIGYCLIIFRNSSNGYYGGELRHEATVPEKDSFIDITTDWNE